MKLIVKGHGELDFPGITPGTLPALRLVQFHSPGLLIVVESEPGLLHVKLSEINLRPGFSQPAPVNHDRAQLAALGK